MNPEGSGGATDESEESAKSNSMDVTKFHSAVIQAMKGEDVQEEETSPAETEKPTTTPEPETGEPDTPKTGVPEGGEAPTLADKTKPDDAVPTEWPDTAKKRVAEEADKRRRAIARAEEAERVKAEYETHIGELKSRLQSAERPFIRGNPLSDVHDERSLKEAEAQYEQLLEFAETNRSGAWDVVTGKNPDGSERREDFTEEDITKMKLTAEKALRTLIPERRTYLTQRTQMDTAAAQIYTPLQDPNSQWSQEAALILKNVPELERVPDVMVWIGHALYRRDEFVRQMAKDNGAGATGSTAEAIVANSRTPKAPSVPSDRGFSQRKDADVEGARKRMKSEGGDDATEDYIGAVLERSRRARMGSSPVR